MLLNKAIIEMFELGVAHRFELDRRQAGRNALDRDLVGFNQWDELISLMISTVMSSGWKIDKTFSVQGNQDLPASHILGLPIWLEPVPSYAEDFGQFSATLAPMGVDGLSDERKIGFRDSPFSDSDG